LEKNELKALGLVVHNYRDVYGRAPASWGELKSYATYLDLDAHELVARVEQRGYEIEWATISQLARANASEVILAHRPADVANGGVVLFLDGHVTQLSTQDFQRYL